VRTTDAGSTWRRAAIEGLDTKTELRSIHAWSADELIVATAGTPCRIYYSKDGGTSWKIVYENAHPEAFIDAMRFWDRRRGFAFGDPINGKLMGLGSDDSGASWRASALQERPLRPGTAGFAASNSSLMLFGQASVWIGLGGASGPSEVLMSDDAGATWTSQQVHAIPSGKSSGIFSLARNPQGQVVAVGGDYTQADATEGNIALYEPQTRVWTKPEGQVPRGFRSCVIHLAHPIGVSPRESQMHWICSGTNGCDASQDGQRWFPISDESFHTMAVAIDGSLWACGAKGRVGLHEPSK
jgi:photosystem II stability/assembly factor-like uncharacterized protein